MKKDPMLDVIDILYELGGLIIEEKMKEEMNEKNKIDEEKSEDINNDEERTMK